MASRAQSRVGEFLIFKRALVLRRDLEGGEDVITGMVAEPFQRAIQEWMALDPDPATNDGFFNPFGTRSASSAYRALKFRSNGPSDTMKRFASIQDAPFKWEQDSSPMKFTYTPQSAESMRNRFIGSDVTRRLPRLADVAAWWSRSRDIPALEDDPLSPIDRLIERLTTENELTEAEVQGLFDTSTELFDSVNGIDDAIVEPSPAASTEA
jgi:hypothetical protein